MSDIEGLRTQEEGKPADSWTRQAVGETLKNKWGSPGDERGRWRGETSTRLSWMHRWPSKPLKTAWDLIFFSSHSCWPCRGCRQCQCVCVPNRFCHVQFFVTPWIVFEIPGSSVHEIPQARVLEWIAIPSSRGSSRPRDRTHISCLLC